MGKKKGYEYKIVPYIMPVHKRTSVQLSSNDQFFQPENIYTLFFIISHISYISLGLMFSVRLFKSMEAQHESFTSVKCLEQQFSTKSQSIDMFQSVLNLYRSTL